MNADEHLADLRRLLAQCEALPGDPVAQAIARGLRASIDARLDDPFAARMRGMLSDYGLAIVDGDRGRQREIAQTIRQAIAAALAPTSSLAH